MKSYTMLTSMEGPPPALLAGAICKWVAQYKDLPLSSAKNWLSPQGIPPRIHDSTQQQILLLVKA